MIQLSLAHGCAFYLSCHPLMNGACLLFHAPLFPSLCVYPSCLSTLMSPLSLLPLNHEFALRYDPFLLFLTICAFSFPLSYQTVFLFYLPLLWIQFSPYLRFCASSFYLSHFSHHQVSPFLFCFLYPSCALCAFLLSLSLFFLLFHLHSLL